MARTTKTQESEVATLEGWKKAAVHNPLLPSGVRVKLRVPDLAAMIETGQVPQHLLNAALGFAKAQTQEDKVPTVEEMTQSATDDREFTDLIVLKSVVEPKLTEADVAAEDGIPIEDKQFIVALATRQRDLDAEGEHIAGLTKSEKFRRFRGLGEFDATLEGL